MDGIKISVIVPVYNVEEYVDECLDSLVKQTLKEIEVIIVNDGSTDGSIDIVRKYIDQNSNFNLINRENGGLSAARNSGLNNARGEYIYFLDSDDYLVDNALEILYKKASSENLDVLKFSAYIFKNHSKLLEWDSFLGYKYRGRYNGVYSGIDILEKFIINNDASYPSCCLILSKKKVIDNNNLKFFEGIINEDNLFHWQLLSLSKRVAVLNLPLYCRRLRTGSITQVQDWNNKIRSMSIIIEQMDIFLKKNQNLINSTSKWYITSFSTVMIGNWQKMKFKDRYKKELIDNFIRIQPIVINYLVDHNKYVLFFYKYPILFHLYYGVGGFIKQNINKKRK